MNGSAVPQLIETDVPASRPAPANTSLRAKSAAPSNASGTAERCRPCVGQMAALDTATARNRSGCRSAASSAPSPPTDQPITARGSSPNRPRSSGRKSSISIRMRSSPSARLCQ
jgi:hypothetical protein